MTADNSPGSATSMARCSISGTEPLATAIKRERLQRALPWSELRLTATTRPTRALPANWSRSGPPRCPSPTKTTVAPICSDQRSWIESSTMPKNWLDPRPIQRTTITTSLARSKKIRLLPAPLNQIASGACGTGRLVSPSRFSRSLFSIQFMNP